VFRSYSQPRAVAYASYIYVRDSRPSRRNDRYYFVRRSRWMCIIIGNAARVGGGGRVHVLVHVRIIIIVVVVVTRYGVYRFYSFRDERTCNRLDARNDLPRAHVTARGVRSVYRRVILFSRSKTTLRAISSSRPAGCARTVRRPRRFPRFGWQWGRIHR